MEDSLLSLWHLVAGMTPYLMFGFLCAGILHVAVPHIFFKNFLSQNNCKSVIWAALFGIPLPLCSCGVLPTAMSLRKEGASKSATVSFLTATPQTGVDSILATYSVFGLAFTIIRPIAALVTSFFSGMSVALFDKEDDSISENEQTCDGSCEMEQGNKCISALRYGYVTMLQDIGTHLVVGLLIAGLIAVAVPDSFLLKFADNPLLEMLAVTLIAVPMYVCATGSIPIAAALMLKGLTPGAALVFLMAGPAVSFASVVVVRKVMGLRTTVIYLMSIIVGAFAFGLLIDLALPKEWFSVLHLQAECCHTSVPVWKVITTIVFLLLVTNALILKYKPKKLTIMKNMTVYKVEGMSCNHCKSNVETNIAKLDGVTSVSADLSTGNVVVEGNSTEEQVKTVVESLGFVFKGRLS